jgi:hypothetical protein
MDAHPFRWIMTDLRGWAGPGRDRLETGNTKRSQFGRQLEEKEVVVERETNRFLEVDGAVAGETVWLDKAVAGGPAGREMKNEANSQGRGLRQGWDIWPGCGMESWKTHEARLLSLV